MSYICHTPQSKIFIRFSTHKQFLIALNNEANITPIGEISYFKLKWILTTEPQMRKKIRIPTIYNMIYFIVKILIDWLRFIFAEAKFVWCTFRKYFITSCHHQPNDFNWIWSISCLLTYMLTAEEMSFHSDNLIRHLSVQWNKITFSKRTKSFKSFGILLHNNFATVI